MKSKLLQHLSFISCDKDAAIMQHVWKMWLIIRQQPSAAIMFFVFVLFCCFFFYIKKKGKTYISYSSVKILWFEVLTMPFLVKYQLLCFFCNKFSEAKRRVPSTYSHLGTVMLVATLICGTGFKKNFLWNMCIDYSSLCIWGDIVTKFQVC